MVNEKTIYSDDRHVPVTTSRFVVGESTYSVSNITSVRRGATEPDYAGPGLAIIIALVVAGFAFFYQYWPVGALGTAVAVSVGYWIWTRNPTYHVLITTTAGELEAISSKEKAYVDAVISAINQAIAERG
jgi:hypothetical protein